MPLRSLIRRKKARSAPEPTRPTRQLQSASFWQSRFPVSRCGMDCTAIAGLAHPRGQAEVARSRSASGTGRVANGGYTAWQPRNLFRRSSSACACECRRAQFAPWHHPAFQACPSASPVHQDGGARRVALCLGQRGRQKPVSAIFFRTDVPSISARDWRGERLNRLFTRRTGSHERRALRHETTQVQGIIIRGQTSGKKPAAGSCARIRASTLSVFTRAWSMAFTCSGFAITTLATNGVSNSYDGRGVPGRFQYDFVILSSFCPKATTAS